MNKNHIVSLSAPKITAAQRKALEAWKQHLEQLIRDAESRRRKIRQLREKERLLEEEAVSLNREAAQFDREAEKNLAATLKQIERVHQEAHAEEARTGANGVVNFKIIDGTQDLISEICQASYHELLDQIGSALAPYYRSFDDARHVARGAPAVNDLTVNLLGRRIYASDSTERMFEGAADTLGRVKALLAGSTIWTFVRRCQS